MKLSILMPVYNERTVVERCIAQVLTAPLPEDMERELIVVEREPRKLLDRLATHELPQVRRWIGESEI